MHGDGEQSRDFTFVANVVDANLLAMDAEGVAGQAINVACGQRFSLNEVIAEIGDIVGHDLTASHDAPRVGDVPHSQADISLARRLLAYEPAVGLREGLERTVEYFRTLRERKAAEQAAATS